MHPDSTHVDNFTPVDDMGEGTQLVFIGSYNVEGATGRDFVQIIKKGRIIISKLTKPICIVVHQTCIFLTRRKNCLWEMIM